MFFLYVPRHFQGYRQSSQKSGRSFNLCLLINHLTTGIASHASGRLKAEQFTESIIDCFELFSEVLCYVTSRLTMFRLNASNRVYLHSYVSYITNIHKRGNIKLFILTFILIYILIDSKDKSIWKQAVRLLVSSLKNE